MDLGWNSIVRLQFGKMLEDNGGINRRGSHESVNLSINEQTNCLCDSGCRDKRRRDPVQLNAKPLVVQSQYSEYLELLGF